MRKAVVLLSGGQDSSTSLFWAKREFDEILALGFDYGQKHKVELECAENIADIADVPFEVIDCRLLLKGSALTEHAKNVDDPHEKDEELPASFVPARNALFLTLAGGYAYRNDCKDIVIGVSQVDYSGYPDCRYEFIRSQEETLTLALDSDIYIHTPLIHLSKAKTWRLANKLGVLDTIRKHTHTDYNGNREQWNEWGYGKLDNEASRIRAESYYEAKNKGWV